MKTRLPSQTELSRAPGPSRPDDLSVLLEEIEHEEVPERLLTLAQKLQAALAARRDEDPAQGS